MVAMPLAVAWLSVLESPTKPSEHLRRAVTHGPPVHRAHGEGGMPGPIGYVRGTPSQGSLLSKNLAGHDAAPPITF